VSWSTLALAALFLVHGHRLGSRGRAIWHMPTRALVYGDFELLSISYDGAGSTG
jgi:hypothetical protein